MHLTRLDLTADMARKWRAVCYAPLCPPGSPSTVQLVGKGEPCLTVGRSQRRAIAADPYAGARLNLPRPARATTQYTAGSSAILYPGI